LGTHVIIHVSAPQYEPEYYWFEVLIIIHKCFMTGALVIIGENSTVQPLVATLFQMGFLLTVLKLSPVSILGFTLRVKTTVVCLFACQVCMLTHYSPLSLHTTT
jgi:hypothetical protein